MRTPRPPRAVLAALGAVLAVVLPVCAAPTVGVAPSAAAAPSSSAATSPAGGHCTRLHQVRVPRAEMQKAACLADLTTAATVTSGHTDPADYTGLSAPGTRNPSGVPGIQVDGYFRDTSRSNAHHGWNHDSQFVIRLPDEWNGKVVVSGAPGTRTQYAGDQLFSDWLLAKGYAYAMTDKGNSGSSFHQDGATPGDAVAEWNFRVSQLTRNVKAVVEQRYGHEAERTYLFGISNGGYLVRWQLENRPWLYDGGVDWEGTLYQAKAPNLLSYLPAALRHYPAYRAGDEAAHQAMLDAGFAPGSEFSWEYHHAVYWDLTQRVYREEFDPAYDGALEAGVPFCRPGVPGCDADYVYADRPEARRAMRKVALTGNIRRPMLTLHGTLDALLPIGTDSDLYRQMIGKKGRSALHRYYRIQGGTHVDGLRAQYGDRVRPLLPCARRAFDRLASWVEEERQPPVSATVRRPRPGADAVNTCSLRRR